MISSRISLLAGLFIASVAAASAAIERTVERAFPVSGAGLLKIETQGGSIKVTPSNDAVVKITAKQSIKASSDSEADELLKGLELTFDHSGNNVTAIARYEKQKTSGWFKSWPPVNVSFTISVPAAYAADLKTSGGEIVVGDLQGKLAARTSGGSLKFGKMGGEVEGSTSGGSISLESASGPVVLNTSGGSINVGRVTGTAKLSTSGGNIRIESASGMVRAATSGGSIRAGIDGQLSADSSLTTSGGSVRVTVNKGVKFDLDASTSGGGVEVAGFTFESVSQSRSKLVGRVNGGGPQLKLRSSGGSVSVRAE